MVFLFAKDRTLEDCFLVEYTACYSIITAARIKFKKPKALSLKVSDHTSELGQTLSRCFQT